MKFNLDIRFEQLVNAIKQLPPAKIMQLKAELENNASAEQSDRINRFQNLLVNGPIMDDVQFEAYRELRKRFDKWNRK